MNAAKKQELMKMFEESSEMRLKGFVAIMIKLMSSNYGGNRTKKELEAAMLFYHAGESKLLGKIIKDAYNEGRKQK